MSDPVAEKSAFLKMYMSGHPDTLVAYAKWYGKVVEPISSAEMTAIDCNSMTLTCTLKNGGPKKEVRVVLDPPLAGYEDVKPRLLEMKALAQEGLGMIQSPILPDFQFPAHAVLTTTLVPICALLYCTLGPRDSGNVLFAPARVLYPYIQGPILTGSWGLLIILHTLEALYVVSLARKHTASFAAGALYVLGTLAFGFPVLVAMRRRIQAARIDSVMKIQ